MTEVPEIPRPSILWKQLSAERRLSAAEAFWRDENAVMEQAEAVAAIAQRIKFRTKSVVALPADKKARHLTALASVSELVAARLLVSYHLQHQRPMMAGFLDALGIAHTDGLIDNEELKAPSPDALTSAVQTIAATHAPEDVSLYLSTLVWQDPDTWGALSEAPETLSRA